MFRSPHLIFSSPQRALRSIHTTASRLSKRRRKPEPSSQPEIVLYQRPSSVPLAVLYAATAGVVAVALNGAVALQRHYNAEAPAAPAPKDGEGKTEGEEGDAEGESTPYWMQHLFVGSTALAGIGIAAAFFVACSRYVIRVSHLPETHELRIHTILDSPMSWRPGRVQLGNGTIVPISSVSFAPRGRNPLLSGTPLYTSPHSAWFPPRIDLATPLLAPEVVGRRPTPQEEKMRQRAQRIYVDVRGWEEALGGKWKDVYREGPEGR